MQSSDRVNWMWTAPGGYDHTIYVAGIVKRVGLKRVTIEVAQKIQGAWVRKSKTVDPAKLTKRTNIVAELGETNWMEMT